MYNTARLLTIIFFDTLMVIAIFASLYTSSVIGYDLLDEVVGLIYRIRDNCKVAI